MASLQRLIWGTVCIARYIRKAEVLVQCIRVCFICGIAAAAALPLLHLACNLVSTDISATLDSTNSMLNVPVRQGLCALRESMRRRHNLEVILSQ